MEEEPPIYRLPHDTLHQIFSSLPLRQIILCRSLSKFFLHLLSTPAFLHVVSTTHAPLHLLALRHRTTALTDPHSSLPLFDSDANSWLHFPFDFLPFHSPLPVASSHGILYLWAQPKPKPNSNSNSNPSTSTSTPVTKSLIACNPLTRTFRVLPHLGSAWSRHGAVLASDHRVMVLTELAFLYCHHHLSPTTWLKFSSNLPSKPRSPLLINHSAFALCDVGSPWRSQWKLFSCHVASSTPSWSRLDRHDWGDVLDILRRPRLVRGHANKILMVGGLKPSYAFNAPCSTILVLRLDLDSLDWDEAARMPPDIFRSFRDSSKFKVFGGGDRVCFSAKRIGKLALWDRRAPKGQDWRWIDNLPGNSDDLYRGFVFQGRLNAVP
ncbi:hypothetical protein VNO78_32972 [Psophocarpus tetragonolobus]|uniref:F-box domain-containing protein n=1 Tax=Psophocarpus tetragonolobus TaxID=3891 RepID=A0AAN9NWH7_PSOTE